MSNANQQGGTAMAAATRTRRELAHRASNGVEVSLVWSQSTNSVSVEVFDAHTDERFEFEVAGSDALDAFNHPYAYATASGVPVLTEALAA
jgi:hypothetical protein